MTSILTSVKKLLGIDDEYTHFDVDIIMHINSVFAVLTQLGVGPSGGFSITDQYATWDDYFGENPHLEMVKSYMYMKVRLMFDPPASGSVLSAMERQIAELEWRLHIESDSTANTDEVGTIIIEWGD